ncbi:transposase [Runella sp.]|jgi:FMN-dependent NADH-azoreductase|uniref:transposase n=1 Tax=Runella sp. TaxID=1960881 RepID=UPI0026396B45|nr:transposase [Runella sp.]
MSKHRKSWSQTEIESILQHYQQHGISATVRQFNVASSMVYRWQSSKDEIKTEAKSGISRAEYHHLLRENQLLKELVAEQELEIRVKDALLKKTIHQNKSG